MPLTLVAVAAAAAAAAAPAAATDVQTADVLVLGAGWAGMSAAHSLALANASFLVLEATNRTGGRTHALAFGPPRRRHLRVTMTARARAPMRFGARVPSKRRSRHPGRRTPERFHVRTRARLKLGIRRRAPGLHVWLRGAGQREGHARETSRESRATPLLATHA